MATHFFWLFSLEYGETPAHKNYYCLYCIEYTPSMPFPAVAPAFELAACLFPYKL